MSSGNNDTLESARDRACAIVQFSTQVYAILSDILETMRIEELRQSKYIHSYTFQEDNKFDRTIKKNYLSLIEDNE